MNGGFFVRGEGFALYDEYGWAERHPVPGEGSGRYWWLTEQIEADTRAVETANHELRHSPLRWELIPRPMFTGLDEA